MELLQAEGAKLSYIDPFAQRLKLGQVEYSTKKLPPTLLAECECALILTAHSCFDYDMIVEQAPAVFDTRKHQGNKHNVVLLQFLFGTTNFCLQK